MLCCPLIEVSYTQLLEGILDRTVRKPFGFLSCHPRAGECWIIHFFGPCSLFRGEGLRSGDKSIPKGSNVVPFWVCYGFLVRDYNILSKKELRRRVWVEIGLKDLDLGLGFRVWELELED